MNLKVIFIMLIFIYTVICGLIITDCAISNLTGRAEFLQVFND